MRGPGTNGRPERIRAQLVALASLMRKELIQTFRDRNMVAMMVVVPLLQLAIFGYAANMEVSHVGLVIADEDHTDQSRRFANQVLAGDTFDHVATLDSARQAAGYLVQGRASVALVLPRGFAEAAAGLKKGSVQVLVDGGQSVTAVVAGNALSQVVSLYSIEVTKKALAERLAGMAHMQAQPTNRGDSLIGLEGNKSSETDENGGNDGQQPDNESSNAPASSIPGNTDMDENSSSGSSLRFPDFLFRPRVFYNPTLESRIFMVPGVAASLLLILTVLVTSMGVVRERETGTLEQVLVSPMSPTVLLLGKTLPYLLIGFVDLLLVIVAAVWLFSIPFRGPVLVILVGGILYLGSTLAVGLTVSTFSSTQQQAVLGGLFVLMPAIVLSGFLAPVDNMPLWMQRITLFDPMRHFVEILRGCMLKGASWRDLAPQLVALASLGAFLMGLASIRFRGQVK